MRFRTAVLALLTGALGIAQAGILEDLGLDSSTTSLPSASMCDALKLTRSWTLEEVPRCTALDFVKVIISNRDATSCDPQASSIIPVKQVDSAGMPLPGLLRDLRPLPATLNKTQVLREEGGTLYWFIRSLFNLEAYSPCWNPIGAPNTSSTAPVDAALVASPPTPTPGSEAPPAAQPSESAPGSPQALASSPPPVPSPATEAPLFPASAPGSGASLEPLPGALVPKEGLELLTNQTSLNLTTPVPAGWTLLGTTFVNEGDDGLRPLAQVIRNASALIVLVRGTQTTFEWNANFNYSMLNTSGLPGLTHAGFTMLAQHVMNNNLTLILDKHVKGGNVSAVIVAGHSLGAGVATVLSVLVKEHLNSTNATAGANATNATAVNATVNGTIPGANTTSLVNTTSSTTPGGAASTGGLSNATNTTATTNTTTANGSSNTTNAINTINATNATSAAAGSGNTTKPGAGILVHALLFAPPSAGDATFNEYFNKHINGRRVLFLYDPIPQLPCSPMIACNSPPDGAWPYAPTGGTVNLTAEDMPLQPEIWQRFDRLELLSTQPFLTATHGCSYICSLARFANDTNNLCFLHKEDQSISQGLGTYCGQTVYPRDPEYP